MSNLNMTPQVCTSGSLMFLRCFQNKILTSTCRVPVTWAQHRVSCDHLIDHSSQQLRWTAAVGQQRSTLFHPFQPPHQSTYRSMGFLKRPSKHRHPLMLTTCLPVPLSRHVAAALSYLFLSGIFWDDTLTWTSGVREGIDGICSIQHVEINKWWICLDVGKLQFD